MRKTCLGSIVRLYSVPDDMPLIGHIAFGLIDRGTNLIQVRPVSTCPLSCVFCSVDAGPRSKRRQTEYVVGIEHILDWFRRVAMIKRGKVQAHIDTVGDPVTYPYLVELVHGLANISNVSVVSIETNGVLLTEKMVDRLEAAGLSRINLSIHSLDPEKAKGIVGSRLYDVERVKGIAEYVAQCTGLDLIITPVWVPGINDQDIHQIIKYALEIGAGKRCPPLGIQKYEAHKYGRKPEGIRPMSWRRFYSELRRLERKYGVKLVLSPQDFGIFKDIRLPLAGKRGENVRVEVVGPGWLKGQWLGVFHERCVTLVGVRGAAPIGEKIHAKLLRVKHNIYVARVLR